MLLFCGNSLILLFFTVDGGILRLLLLQLTLTELCYNSLLRSLVTDQLVAELGRSRCSDLTQRKDQCDDLIQSTFLGEALLICHEQISEVDYFSRAFYLIFLTPLSMVL